TTQVADSTEVANYTERATDDTLDTDLTTVTIVVTAVNDAPVANNDSFAAVEDTTLNVAAPGVQANDSDVDGDALNVALLTSPANGTLTLNANGSFSYRPNLNFNGSDSFTYQVSDGQLTAVATALLNV